MAQEEQYLLSMDGGGTKTEICVKNISSGDTENFFFESTNYKNIGIEKTTSVILDSLRLIYREMSIDGTNIKGMVAGISGCDTESDYRIYETMINQTDLQGKVRICNDSELAFLATAAQNGVCSVCGTGSIVIGFQNGKMECRCGGWGSPLSDEGSGYWIASQVLKDLIRWCDGNETEKAVFHNLMEFYHVEKQDAPYILSQLDRMQIASSAQLILSQASEGDSYCGEVIRKAGNLIGEMMNSVIERTAYRQDEKLNIVLTGSIYKNELFTAIVKKQVHWKNMEYSFRNESPAGNGIAYAEKLFVQTDLSDR